MESSSKITKRRLLNALQKSQADGLRLLTQEMRYHALCYRSITVVPHYTELLVRELRPFSDPMDEKQRLAESLEWTQILLESASGEISEGYASVSQRTVIVLADLLENLIESTIGLCLLHLDPAKTNVREVARFKQEITDERRLKRAVRSWESSLFEQLSNRTDRIEHMILSFFPGFIRPEEYRLLDRLFEDRNIFTHEKIKLTEMGNGSFEPKWTLQMVDDAFRVAGDFLIALMNAVPGDLEAPIDFSQIKPPSPS